MSHVVVEFADARDAYRALAELRRLSLVTDPSIRVERIGRRARLIAAAPAWSNGPLQDVCRRFGGVLRREPTTNGDRRDRAG